MIKNNSVLTVIDNSGVKKVKCIQVLGGYKKKYAKLGDLIMVTVKEIRFNSLKIKKKDIFKALVIRTKSYENKKFRVKMLFNSNCVVLLDKFFNPIGTRIFGYVPKMIKKKIY